MERTFGITPSSEWPFIFIAVIGVILLAVLVLLVLTGYSARNASFEVSDQGLRIRAVLYGRFIPKQDIMSSAIRTVNLNHESDYKPKLRTNGIGMPGYSEGWFRLNNNEKALLFVTDYSRVVYLPTTQNYSVLLSVRNSEDFLNTIKMTWQ